MLEEHVSTSDWAGVQGGREGEEVERDQWVWFRECKNTHITKPLGKRAATRGGSTGSRTGCNLKTG